VTLGLVGGKSEAHNRSEGRSALTVTRCRISGDGVVLRPSQTSKLIKLIDKPVNFAYGDGSEIYEIALFMTSKWGTRYSKLVYVEELELL